MHKQYLTIVPASDSYLEKIIMEIRRFNHVAVIQIPSCFELGRKTDIDELKSHCVEIVHDGISDLIFDMSEIENAPSILLSTIILWHKKMKELGGKLFVLKPTDRVAHIFDITKIDRIVRVFDSEEVALKAMAVVPE